MSKCSQPNLDINIFQFHLTPERIKRRLGGAGAVTIVAESDLGGAGQPMEFFAYARMLRAEAPAVGSCAIVCNDTALTKEYSGFLADVYNRFNFIAAVVRPMVVGVLDKSLFGISAARPSPPGLHLRSHFFMVNRAGWDLLAEGMVSACEQAPGQLAHVLAQTFFDAAHVERKSKAMAAEQWLSDFIFSRAVVLDCSLSRKIALRRMLFEAKRYVFRR